MTETVRTIRLYGKLGTQFGRVHKFVCNDTAGAIRALCQMIPGFQEYLNTSKDRGLGYAVFADKENLSEQALHLPVGAADIRIAPIILGSGRGGFFSIILGAALIGAAFITGGVSLTASGLAFSGLAGQVAFGLGVSLLLGGVSQLLVKQPRGMTSTEVDNGASYSFNGPVNVTSQGNPVPVLYGEAIVGSIVVSADLYSEDQA